MDSTSIAIFSEVMKASDLNPSLCSKSIVFIYSFLCIIFYLYRMAVLPLEEYLQLIQSKNPLIIDARSENEYLHAQIPGAINIPLLNNEHRHLVGTCFKQEGREAAVRLGFELVGPLFSSFVKIVDELNPANKEVFVYCWRGGMRSGIMTWILSMAGYKTTTLKGGYKAFRRYVFEELAKPKKMVILGGHTGTGKTILLKALHKAGQQTIDLEGLAYHRGSAFGAIGLPPQPTNEHFENMLAMQWRQIDPNKIVWLESESRSIGRIKIPDQIYPAFNSAPIVEINMSFERRIKNILVDYGSFPKQELADCTRKIEKRLGNLRMKECLAALEENRMEDWVSLLLIYYDKLYSHSLQERSAVQRKLLQVSDDVSEEDVVRSLIKLAD